MTPDTPNKAPLDKGQRARSESAGADEWRPDGQEAAAGNQDSDDLAEEDSEDSGKEYGSPKKSKKRTARATSAPKTPKRGKVGSSLQSSPRSSSRAPSSGWSQEELLALYTASFRLAMQNIPTICQEPGLEGRSNAPVNMKMRAEFKKTLKALGGDGAWIDSFKLGTSPGSKKGK